MLSIFFITNLEFIYFYFQEKIVPLVHGYIRMQCGEGGLLTAGQQPVSLEFMQDGAPAHSARATLLDMRERGITVITWPPYSPDLNPIENCWNKMKSYQGRMWGDEACPLEEERRRIQHCWDTAVTEEYLEELVRSMPQRCADVIAARGGPTKW